MIKQDYNPGEVGTYPEEYDVSDKKIMKKDGKPTPPPSPIWKGHKTRKPPNILSRDRNKKGRVVEGTGNPTFIRNTNLGA